jgi:hypothetical protein
MTLVTNSVPTELSVKMNVYDNNNFFSYSFNSVIPPNADFYSGCLLASPLLGGLQGPLQPINTLSRLSVPTQIDQYVIDTSNVEISLNDTTSLKLFTLCCSLLLICTSFYQHDRIMGAFGVLFLVITILYFLNVSKPSLVSQAPQQSSVWKTDGRLNY